MEHRCDVDPSKQLQGQVRLQVFTVSRCVVKAAAATQGRPSHLGRRFNGDHLLAQSAWPA
jgi:hypothetical protein